MVENKNSFQLLLELWKKINKRRKYQTIFLIILMVISATVEIFSLTSVIPFLTAISEPNILWEIDNLRLFAIELGIESSNDLIVPTTILFIFASICSCALRLITQYFNFKLSASIGSDLSKEAYKKSLLQPFEFHLNNNSSEIISTVTTQITYTVNIIVLAFQLITSLVIVLAIIFTLLYVNIKISSVTITIFVISYLILYFLNKKRLKQNSVSVARAVNLITKLIQEGLGSIKDLILSNNQENFFKSYAKTDFKMRQKQAESKFLRLYPKYIVECSGVILIATLVLILKKENNSVGNIFPILGMIALSAQRLLPALQQIYGNWAQIQGNSESLKLVINMLDQKNEFLEKKGDIKPLDLKQNIELKNIYFKYPKSEKYVINDLNLKINAGERIGITGKTGEGKSTLLDIIMCLLKPNKGKILIDGKDLYESDLINNWRMNIAHVPQFIFLTDGTIAENIALGVNHNEIDYRKVKKCANQALVSEFIDTSKSKYLSNTGERGIKLSGGQLQRIGLARALYKNKRILFLDEATSALDGKTENSIMESLDNLSNDITIFIIAHRKNTLKKCNKIINIKNGKIDKIIENNIVN